jgi:hypothetical protein
VRSNALDGLAIVQITIPDRDQVVSMITLAYREQSKLTTDFKSHLRDYVKTSYMHQ